MSDKIQPQSKILVIDDDPALILIAQQVFMEQGYQVFASETGQEGLDILASQRPDLVLLDVMLPDTDGYDICAQLRLKVGNHLPVLMMTGLNDNDSVNRAYEAGATDFIHKPIQWQILTQRVRYLLRSAKTRVALDRSETRAHSLVEALPDMLFRIDRNGLILEVTRPEGQAFNDIPRQLEGRDICQIAPLPLANKIRAKFQLALQTVETHVLEFGIRYNRQLLVREIRLCAITDQEILALLRDVTDRRRAERESRRREHLYQALFENNRASMLLVDPASARIVDANPAACHYYGYSRDKFRKMMIYDLNTLSPEECFVVIEQARQQQKNHFHFHHRLANGEIREIEAYSSSISVGGRSLLYSILHDITDRNNAKRKLLNANRLLRLLSEGNAAVAIADEEDQLLNNICRLMVDVGGYCMAWVGYAQPPPAQKVYPVAQWGDDVQYLASLDLSWGTQDTALGPVGRAIRTGNAVAVNDLATDPTFAPRREQARQQGYASFLALPLKTGRRVVGVLNIKAAHSHAFAEDEVALLQRLADNLAHGIVALWGRLEKQKTDENLLRSERKFRELSHEYKNVLDGIPDSLILLDRDCRIIWANRGAQLTTDAQSQQSSRQSCQLCGQSNLENCSDCLVRQSFVSGRAEEGVEELPNGQIHGIKVFPLHDDRGNVIQTVRLASDITEKVRLREENLRSSRLASLGELAAGVAHEINNPTGLLLHNLPLLDDVFRDVESLLAVQRLPADFKIGGLSVDRARDVVPLMIEDMLRGAGRIKNIVDDLKTYARQGEPDLTEDVNLNEVVDAALRMLANPIKKMTDRLTIDLSTTLPLFRGCFQRIEQVVINLIQNACQALPDRSKGVSVSTRYHADKSCLILEVRDEGIGIAAKHLAHVTEPFFTTKRNQGGTGLGLSVSARIVHDHGGKLHFRSQPGNGTSVILELMPLPAVSDSPTEMNSKLR